jgi:hypothetical protein
VIEFFADGIPIGRAETDGGGRAEIGVPARYRGGQHDFEARFSGDDFYRGSTGTAGS